MHYCAIIGDMVGSRRLPAREQVQEQFFAAVERINARYREYITSPFVVTLGDEFQGLLSHPAASYRLIEEFRRDMAPVNFVFGVGIGAISTAVNPAGAIGMDGEAFHRARAMVGRAKKQRPTVCYGADKPEIELVNAVIYLVESFRRKQTRRQKEVIALIAAGHRQQTVAEKLGISQATVSTILKTSLHEQIIVGEEAVCTYLANWHE